MKPEIVIDNHFENPLFVAKVEDNNDPTFNYRVKVRIPNLHPEETVTTEQLPWAARLDSTFMGIGDEQDLKHAIPEIGTQVLVLAVGDDINSLLYLGCLYKKTPQTPEDNRYLDTYGIYRKDGQFIGVDKIKKLFQMLFDGDIEVDKVHNIKVNATDNITVICNQADITTNGATNLTANGNLTVTAPTSTFDGDIVCTGTIKSTGNITSEADVISSGCTLNTHVHEYVVPEHPAGNTDTSNGHGPKPPEDGTEGEGTT